jgi:L-alanine-DL-glutamate epimerase-like enolase superfamily enzyme
MTIALAHTNTLSRPYDLCITGLGVVGIVGAPFISVLLKIYTNQGLIGLGQVRDGARVTYALMLKSRLLGENRCAIDRLFRRIKQFGGHSRQDGGVSAVGLALWELVGRVYGLPVYQMLGGKFRDKVRICCDSDAEKPCGTETGQRMKARINAVCDAQDVMHLFTGLPGPLVKGGFITVTDQPGLGIDDRNDALVMQQLQPGVTVIWQPTDRCDNETAWNLNCCQGAGSTSRRSVCPAFRRRLTQTTNPYNRHSASVTSVASRSCSACLIAAKP